MRIGIDLGGTSIKAGLVDESGKILHKTARSTEASRPYEAVLADIISQIDKTAQEAEVDLNAVQSIGLGIPGLIDYDKGAVIYCANLGWHHVPVVEILKKHFQKPVYIENDATVAGFAENLFGSTRGARHSVFLTLGTGVGAGIIIDGKILRGAHNAASEIGHMIVGDNFYDCNCGKSGCLETFASATALVRYVRWRMEKEHIQTSLKQYTSISAKAIFEEAQKGDELAQEALYRFIKYLAIGISNIFNILDPDTIAIGGGISQAGAYLLDLLKPQVEKMRFCSYVQYGDIKLAELGNDAGIIGAAFLDTQAQPR